MQVYMQVVGLDEVESPQALAETLAVRVAEEQLSASLLHEAEAGDEAQSISVIGISLKVRKALQLKAPLKLLYTLAKEQKIDFEAGVVDEDSGDFEPVCYFGHHEGELDSFEMANYLGL